MVHILCASLCSQKPGNAGGVAPSTQHLRTPKAIGLEGQLKWDSFRRSMTPLDRRYREQYLKDQRLAPHEPDLNAYHKLQQSHRNFIRRAYGKIPDLIFKPLIPIMGHYKAGKVRYIVPRMTLYILLPIYATWYFFKYNAWEDWERLGGWRLHTVRPPRYPGDPGFGVAIETGPKDDYSNYGRFKDRKVFKDL